MYDSTIRTVEEGEELCLLDNDCRGFHRFHSGTLSGVCIFQSLEVKGNGAASDNDVDCYVKNDNLRLDQYAISTAISINSGLKLVVIDHITLKTIIA